MTNYVPINNTILRDIVRSFNSQYWSRFMNKRVCLVFRGAKVGGVGGVATPPEFWNGIKGFVSIKGIT